MATVTPMAGVRHCACGRAIWRPKTIRCLACARVWQREQHRARVKANPARRRRQAQRFDLHVAQALAKFREMDAERNARRWVSSR